MGEADAGFARALEAVRSLAEDEVLRAFDNLLKAALRTNAYQRPERPVFSVKVDCRKVEGMPSPRPMFEIYVHSRRLEGIHLRGGKVARGGIRWSDRHDDFRTEILGLMKTQMVKNSVIVPVGSKGGFVLKGDVPPRPALDEYLIDRYREFVSGLLDVTDNRADGKVLHPPEVVRQDGDDPYLVVAADKGTAHLSDTANRVSAQYGFWLGDAFASGGSAGYDHKKMGITARGAWECVKHHFRNLGTDIQKEPFTVAGVGDMSGDVFGNGVLLSRAIKLVAVFDHRNIFIDPDPDPEKSFRERERVFALARSSWRDYDPALLSKGGGVYDRSAKAIPLSPEARKLLDIEGGDPSGEEVMRKILTARVDLLYNGGIGTYVKAESEEHGQVGDRTNDRVRVNGREVRARVIGEGGNLGLTQKGRLEYWAAGGRLNTDAVDNSGGVDTSDHEVNIKILLDMLVKKGVVKGREERNRILAEMTDDVAALVLADNAGQALALSLDGHRSARRYEEFVALVDDMAGAGLLNRADESVPTREELLASPHRDRGLPRPLLCVLLGYSKMSAFQLLLETDFPDGAAGRPFLDGYFPRLLRERFAEHFQDHVLRREIVATGAVNYLVNRGGTLLLPRLEQGAKNGIGEAVTAWIEVDREAEAQALREAVLASGRPAGEEQAALLEIEDALEAAAQERLRGQEGRGCEEGPPGDPEAAEALGGPGVTRCLFVSDLHGRASRYEALLGAMAAERPAAVFLGGDLLPSGSLPHRGRGLPPGLAGAAAGAAARAPRCRVPRRPRHLRQRRPPGRGGLARGAGAARARQPRAPALPGRRRLSRLRLRLRPPHAVPPQGLGALRRLALRRPRVRVAGGRATARCRCRRPRRSGARSPATSRPSRGRPTSRAPSSCSTRRPTGRPSTARRSTGGRSTTPRSTCTSAASRSGASSRPASRS